MLRATDSGRLTDEAKASSSGAPRTITDRNGDAGPSHTPYSEDRSTGSRASEDGVRIKDLDSGKEYNLRKENTIRDLTTGQLYIWESGPADNSGEHVTDLASGKQLSLEEFDSALGLNTRGDAARRRKQQGPVSHQRNPSGEISSDSAGNTTSSQPPKAGKKSWLKRINFRGASKVKSSTEESDNESDVSHSTASNTAGSSFTAERESGGASVSGRGVPVKVHVHRKAYKDLSDLHLIQEIHSHVGVVWSMKFSKDGKYLASAGQDMVVHVWEVLQRSGQPPDGASSASEAESTQPETSGELLNVVSPIPYRVYKGHKQDILDVAWSRSQFLLSASMDKTVRLWHISLEECLRTFRHTDFVTALDFHPIDDKFFISGSIDGNVRVWNIPEQRVVDYADVHEMVTATVFTADGARAVVGTMKGKCRFYQCGAAFKLDYEAQIDVKNRRGKTSKGKKITGMSFVSGDPSKLLITSNDSRIRLYDGYSLRCKFKGHHNRNTQIRASFSDSGDFIVCGSDDGWVYLWQSGAMVGPNASNAPASLGAKQEKSTSYECFQAHDDIVTVAIFGPAAACRTLPPPALATPAKGGCTADSPGRASKLRSRFGKDDNLDLANKGAVASRARASGQVLLTAGYSGEIKVFENRL